MTLTQDRLPPTSGLARAIAGTLLPAALFLQIANGCGDVGCDRSAQKGAAPGRGRGIEWTFDGSRIAGAAGAPIVSPVADVRWAAVVDADSKRTAWLVVPHNEAARIREVEPGQSWAGAGYVRGPGRDVPVLRENRLMSYEWKIERADDNSLAVTYSAKVLQHVVLASFSKFTLAFPLRLFQGGRGTVDDTYGGVIREAGPIGPVHPSYWEGPASALGIDGRHVRIDMELDKGAFSWVSLLDGRALSGPDSLLVLELYPSIAGPHNRLGKLAVKGSYYTASFKIALGPAKPSPPEPGTAEKAGAESPPAPLPMRLAKEVVNAGWEIEPFVKSGDRPALQGFSFGDKAFSSEVPVSARSQRWRLSVPGSGRPVPAFIAVRGPVEDLRVKINGTGDCLDARGLVEDIGATALDPRARAEVLWRYFASTTYPMPLYPTKDLGEFLGSYGYGFSSTLNTMALVKFWSHAGLPARRVYLNGRQGHAIAEAHYGGRWHAFDLTARTFYVDAAGEVASADDLVSQPGLVKANSDASGKSPGGVAAREEARLRYEGAKIAYNPAGLSFERTMRIRLARGETLLRLYRPMGKWAPSPRRPLGYANALLAFTPSFTKADVPEGFSSSANFKMEDGALVPEDPSAVASLDYRARSPYVITQARLVIDAPSETLERASALLSKDGGESWAPVELDAASGLADLTSLLVPGAQKPGAAYEELERNFGYDLHLEFSPSPGREATTIRNLSVFTWCQVNPALLPRLSSGDNDVVTECAGFGPGAALSLGWIESAVRADPEYGYLGETFHLMGDITSGGGRPAGDVQITARLAGEGPSTQIGSWKGSVRRDRGKTPFDIECGPINPKSQRPGGPPGEYRLMLEIDSAGSRAGPASWPERSLVKLPLRTRPDLVARSELVKVTPSHPKPGEEVRITAVVRNFCPARELLYMQGTRSGPTVAALYDSSDDPPLLLQKSPIPELAPASVALVAFNWRAPKAAGCKSLLLVLDPDDSVRERDENNSTPIEVDVASGP